MVQTSRVVVRSHFQRSGPGFERPASAFVVLIERQERHLVGGDELEPVAWEVLSQHRQCVFSASHLIHRQAVVTAAVGGVDHRVDAEAHAANTAVTRTKREPEKKTRHTTY